MSMAGYETIIGLEVHCELKTETKLFCGCRNAFGDEPNTNVCPVCVGLPGSIRHSHWFGAQLRGEVVEFPPEELLLP